MKDSIPLAIFEDNPHCSQALIRITQKLSLKVAKEFIEQWGRQQCITNLNAKPPTLYHGTPAFANMIEQQTPHL